MTTASAKAITLLCSAWVLWGPAHECTGSFVVQHNGPVSTTLYDKAKNCGWHLRVKDAFETRRACAAKAAEMNKVERTIRRDGDSPHAAGIEWQCWPPGVAR